MSSTVSKIKSSLAPAMVQIHKCNISPSFRAVLVFDVNNYAISAHEIVFPIKFSNQLYSMMETANLNGLTNERLN